MHLCRKSRFKGLPAGRLAPPAATARRGGSDGDPGRRDVEGAGGGRGTYAKEGGRRGAGPRALRVASLLSPDE